jgi:hypothetical protein
VLALPPEGDGKMSCAAFGCLEPSFRLFDISFFLLLILYLFLNHLGIKANGVNTITLCPEMIEEIGLFRSSLNRLNNLIDVCPFSRPMKPDIESFGGTITIKCA